MLVLDDVPSRTWGWARRPLSRVFGRVQALWEPVAKEGSIEIVRREILAEPLA